MIYLAWSDHPIEMAPGPWEDWYDAAPGVVLVDSRAGRSPVFHAVKDLLPPSAALVVGALHAVPKNRGLARGSTAWLRARLPGHDPGTSTTS